MKAQRAYIYTTAANGMEVRIPRDKFPEWQAEQEKIKAGEAVHDTQTAKLLSSLMKGEK